MSSENDQYRIKYLKYKNKYNTLKSKLNQHGSSIDGDYINKLKELYPTCQFDKQNNHDTYSNYAIVYGEMTYKGINQLNTIVNPNNDFKYFIDIGSGRLKLPIYMASNPNIIKSYGIELVTERYNDGMQLLDKLKQNSNFNIYTSKITSINDDLFNIDLRTLLPEKTFVWISNLCFSENINDKLFHKLTTELKPESIICCSKQPSTDIPGLEFVRNIPIQMSWTENSDTYIYKVR